MTTLSTSHFFMRNNDLARDNNRSKRRRVRKNVMRRNTL